MRILVTGGCGFIGNNLINKLKSQNFNQRVAGDKIYLKAYCVPQNTE